MVCVCVWLLSAYYRPIKNEKPQKKERERDCLLCIRLMEEEKLTWKQVDVSNQKIPLVWCIVLISILTGSLRTRETIMFLPSAFLFQLMNLFIFVDSKLPSESTAVKSWQESSGSECHAIAFSATRSTWRAGRKRPALPAESTSPKTLTSAYRFTHSFSLEEGQNFLISLRLLQEPANRDPQFHFAYRGPVVMKGKAEPMKVYYLNRASDSKAASTSTLDWWDMRILIGCYLTFHCFLRFTTPCLTVVFTVAYIHNLITKRNPPKTLLSVESHLFILCKYNDADV